MANIARVLTELSPFDAITREQLFESSLQFAICLARFRGAQDPNAMFNGLNSYPLSSLSDPQKLLKLRALTLAFARQGRPSDDWVEMGAEKLLAQYPAQGQSAQKLNH